MKFPGWVTHENNLARQASVTVTNPTDTTNYPETNLTSLPVSATVRFNNRASNKIHLTFGRAVSLDFAALCGHNLSSGATITLRAGATWDAATVSQAVTWRRRTSFIYLASAENYRYWSIEITDTANEHAFLEAGYVLLGNLVVSAYGPADGWENRDQMIQVSTDSATGTPDIRALSERQRVSLAFSPLSTAELTVFRDLFLGLQGRDEPLFFVPDTLVNDGFFGRFESPDFSTLHVDDKNRSTNLTLLEDPAGLSLEVALPKIESGKSLPTDSVFTRASVAWRKNQSLELESYAVDTLRDPHFLDHGKRGILIEPERLNSWTYFEDLSNGVYALTRTTVSADATDEPKATAGTVADKLVEDGTASTTHWIGRDLATATDDTVQSVSFFAKAAERTWLRVELVLKDGSINFFYLNLTDGTVGTESGLTELTDFVIEPYANGWYRILMAKDVLSGGSTPEIRIKLATGNGGQSYSGDSSSGAYLWGFQHEVDRPWPSSIIPTVAGTATRNGDVLQVPLAFGPEPFTAYLSYIDVGQHFIPESDGYMWFFGHRTSTTTDPRVFIRKNAAASMLAIFDDATSVLNPTRAYTGAIGAAMEVRVAALPDGTLTLSTAVDGAAESTTTESSPTVDWEAIAAWPEAWMVIGEPSATPTLSGLFLLRKLTFERNSQTLATMRLL